MCHEYSTVDIRKSVGERRVGPRSATDPAGIMTLYGRGGCMERQQIIALLFAFLMVSSMVAWGVSII